MMALRPSAKQIFANIEQGPTDSDRDYIVRVDELLLEGEPMGDKAKVMGAVRGLRLNTKLRKLMYKEYPSSYAEFRWKAGNHISKAEMLAMRLGERVIEDEVKKPEPNLSSSHWKGGNQRKFTSNFKPFGSEIEVKLTEVFNVAPNEVYNQIKDKKLLEEPRTFFSCYKQ